MSGFFFERYMGGFGRGGRKDCSCGLSHELATREILLADGALEAIGERVVRDYGPAAAVWVLSDERTEAAAGRAVKAALRRGAGGALRLAETVLPAGPKPVCTMELIERLAGEVRRASPGLIVSVGGGTMSDLGKKLSADLGLPNWAVMTAPSVDGHTSRAVNIKTPSGTLAIPAAASQRVFCEPAVLEAAPREMFLAGLGDSAAKFFAYLDWRLEALIAGAPICMEAADVSLQSARQALQAALDAGQPGADRRQVCVRLADALLTSGLVMQTLGSSRAAASAEHTASHHWTTARSARVARLDLHGLLVGLAGRLVYEAYRDFYALLAELPIDVPSRLEALRREPPWRETLDEEIRPFQEKLEREMKGRELDLQACRRQLLQIERHRDRIRRMAAGVLDEVEEGLQVLREQGFPFDPAEYGMSRPEVLLPFRYLRYLRNRFTSFDIMHLLGVEETIYRKIEARL